VKEHNDFSVFSVWGVATDGLYWLDMVKGKWEAPELRKKAVEVWEKWANFGKGNQCTGLYVEDKSSGTGMIQDLQRYSGIPVIPVERNKDKLTRLESVLSYIEAGKVKLPRNNENMTKEIISESEAFTRNDSHSHDDIIDTMIDGIEIGLRVPNVCILDVL
jgi:predicted phage terminase large subunit-like protein